MAITAFLSRSPGLLNRGPGGPASLGHGPHCSIFSPTAQSGAWGPLLLGAGLLYCILSPTDWTSCASSYIIVRHPPSSCGRHKSHSFNPSTVKVIFWYSSTGCTCYLHRYISYFDSLARVNMQHYKPLTVRSKQVEFRFITKVNHIPLFLCPQDMLYGEVKMNLLIFLWNQIFATWNPSEKQFF